MTTILILLGLRWLPKRFEEIETGENPWWRRLRRSRDLGIAFVVGAGMATLAYAVMVLPMPETIGSYFLERAYTEGGGRNVVNVILVDFRGFDTLGEITVLAVVALTIFALLRRFRPAPDNIGSPLQQRRQNAFDEAEPDRKAGDTLGDYLLVPSVIMKWLFPVIIVLAIYLFLRGHDLPGGGFAAGIALATAFILQYLASGTIWVEDRLRILPVNWIGLSPVAGRPDRHGVVAVRLSLPDHAFAIRRNPADRDRPRRHRPVLRPGGLRSGRRRDGAHS